MVKFSELGLKKEIVSALSAAGITELTPIQENAIPHAMKGEDVIGQAHTGTGKTFAFGLPIIDKIDPDFWGPVALIITPTRELALQIREEIKKASVNTGVKSVTLYGGTNLQTQIDSLKWGQQIIVATPGRLIDLFKKGATSFKNVKYVVLDEADRMFDMGFIDDIKFVMDNVPKERQTMLFSATMPPEIIKLSEKYMKSPVKVLLDTDDLSADLIEQTYLVVDERRKLDHLTEILRTMKGKIVIFCSTKMMTRRLSQDLYRRGFRTVAIHGDLDQERREKALGKFKQGIAQILVATDVAARGLDIPMVEHVVNYDVPFDPMMYFHRIGRTARAGKSGKALTLVTQREYDDFQNILKHTQTAVKQLNEELGIKVEPHEDYHKRREFPGRRFPEPRGHGRRFPQRREHGQRFGEGRPHTDGGHRRPFRRSSGRGVSR